MHRPYCGYLEWTPVTAQPNTEAVKPNTEAVDLHTGPKMNVLIKNFYTGTTYWPLGIGHLDGNWTDDRTRTDTDNDTTQMLLLWKAPVTAMESTCYCYGSTATWDQLY